jgi:hypothetical protein
METNDIDFSTKPNGYKLCFSDKCLNAKKCLRRIAIEQIKDSAEVFQVINHFKFEETSCKYFADSNKTKIAYGLKNAFKNILVSDAEKIRFELIQHFGQTEFYRRRNGTKPISPKEQLYIENLFASFNYSLTYDKIIETTFWEN